MAENEFQPTDTASVAPSKDLILVSGEEALAEFRKTLTGGNVLRMLKEARKPLFINLDIGVGKSTLLDACTYEALREDLYHLVVVLCATKEITRERRPLNDDTFPYPTVYLKARPEKQCGELNQDWKSYERARLGALGRQDICGRCPHRSSCFWPNQYDPNHLEGTRLIYAAQKHLDNNPWFPNLLVDLTKAESVLVLLDESHFILRSSDRRIRGAHLTYLAEALEVSKVNPTLRKMARALQRATTKDLRESSWFSPRLDRESSLKLQATGRRMHGAKFKFILWDVQAFAASPQSSRRKSATGDIHFEVQAFPSSSIIFSGTTNYRFAELRFRRTFIAPYQNYRFSNPHTRWFNICSSIGMRTYWLKHSKQVLDFFAQLIESRMMSGKRVLLVSKKDFLAYSRDELMQRFTGMKRDYLVKTDGLTKEVIADQKVVPLINYGRIGINLFEDFDAVYCLNSYYADTKVVSAFLKKLFGWRDLALSVHAVGSPPRRRGSLSGSEGLSAGMTEEAPEGLPAQITEMAQPTLQELEDNVVLQVVGRVRPFTRPREVITMQQCEFPGVRYEAEFTNLEEAREYFQLMTGIAREKESKTEEARKLSSEGVPQKEIARLLEVHPRTVRRYLKGQ